MKKFIVIGILLVVVLSTFIVKVNGDTGKKISPSLVYSAEEDVPIIVELNSMPIVVYQKTFRFKLLSMFSDNRESRYSKELETKQKIVINYVKGFNGEVKFRYKYLFNGFSCIVKGKYIEDIARIENVKKIFKDERAYLERTYATRVIKSDIVNRITDSTGEYITGKGVIVGIVDTGIDYNDKELGNGGFPNSKVIGGYDFADMDNDPMDTDGHGTHVAGIIGGSSYGVAPDVKIRAYKVFTGSDETTFTSTIVEGIEQAAKDNCDIINVSIGTVGGEGKGSDPESVAVENAISNGIVVVAAAGNSGCRSDLVPFPMSAPASNENVIGVGASDDAMHGVISLGGKDITGMYPDKSPFFKGGAYGIVYCGYGQEKDFSGKDLKGKIAFMQRGIIYFGDKDLNAKKAGAEGVIVFNNVSGLPPIALQSKTNPDETNFIPFIFISYTDGMYIKQHIKDSTRVRLDNQYGLGRMSSFSANGPTTDFYLKPDIVAPGVDINSTVLNDKILSMSGTSMASPFVTGSVALIKQTRKSLKPEEIKSLIMNTARILKNPVSGRPYSPLMQGSGRIDVQSAVTSNVLVEPASFIFGNGEKEESCNFTVKNLSSSSSVFSISFSIFSNETISLTYPDSIYVAPFSNSNFTVHFKADKNTKGEVYGFISLSGENAQLHVPFVYLSSLKEREYLENIFQAGNNLPEDKSIKINFTVGIGTEDDTSVPPFRENIAGEVRVDIYNVNGEFVDTVFDQSPVYIGDYSVGFDGRDIFGNYFLNNGGYYYKIVYLEANDNEATKTIKPVVVKDERSDSFTISNVPANYLKAVPGNNNTLLLKKGEDFWVNILFQSEQPLSTLQISYKYDESLLTVLGVEKGEVALNNKVDFNDTEHTGIVYIALSGEIGEKGTIARIHFKAIENGIDFIYPLYISTSTTENFMMKPLKYEISNYSRIWDINDDKKVDDADLVIFRKSFGLNKNDADFNLNCDFNRDGMVDGKDFLVLTRHYGEIYP